MGQGASFWDDFLENLKPRYEAVAKDKRGWLPHCEAARELRDWYEVALSDFMAKYSEHPTKPLTELEAFTGTILNKSGAQNNRQREASIKLKQDVDRTSAWITGEMRRARHVDDANGSEGKGRRSKFDSLYRCMACVKVSDEQRACQRDSRRGQLQSFKVIAACALLTELSLFERGRRGGGFVGVRA